MNLTTIKASLGRLWPQLRTGSGTEGEDCAAIAILNMIKKASGGKVGPDMLAPAQDPQSVANWVKYIRRIANRPEGGLMVFGDAYEVLNSPEIRGAFRANNLTPPTVQYHYGMSFSDLRQWLTATKDRIVFLAIDYGVARKSGCPVGSTSFSDGHAIVLTGMQRRRFWQRRRWVTRWATIVGDSLFDGRRKPNSLKRYPKGWQIARYYRYMKAAAAFGTGPDGKPRPIGPRRAVCITMEIH